MTGSHKKLDIAASSSRQVKLRSVISDDGENTSKCGYCKSSSPTSIAHGLWAYSLTVDDYQDLLDRGWRRAGMYLYQPNMRQTCCPQYTIRLQATTFVPSKEQRRVLNRMQRYLHEGYKGTQPTGIFHEKLKDTSCGMEDAKGNPDSSFLLSESCLPSDCRGSVSGENCHNHFKVMDIDGVTQEWISLAIKNAIVGLTEEYRLPENVSIPEIVVKRVTTKLKKQLNALNSGAVYTSNVAFSLVANVNRVCGSAGPRNIMLESKENLDSKPEDLHRYSSTVLAELLALKVQSSHSLQGLMVEACKGHLNFFSENNQHEDGNTEVATLCQKRSNEVLPAFEGLKETSVILPTSTKHTLDVRMKRSKYDPEEFSLYKKYQVAVHNDKPEQVKESAYKRFLVDSPLIPVPPDGSTPFCGFGSFHQQYRINGQLVAVGVVDILPRCLSSKYLFWDPDFAFLSLGKYASLREINWVQEARTLCQSLDYYYLGYYIHSCPKMRYKAAYSPSELLCPEQLTWVPYTVAKPLLDKQSYACLSKAFLERSSPGFSKVKFRREASSFLNDVDMKDISTVRDVELVQDKGQHQQAQFEDVEELLAIEAMESKDTLECLNNIQVRLNGMQLRFQQLDAWGLGDLLKDRLKKYLDRVGSALAGRMDYVLP
ncbi:hypothetical protein O6H91_16G080200 [Diphasiastrum complanatum]|uniref:Uncharacterized protein n=5 Tax=Diphasiastrum complanatum TaxID=34168 RepID=A0ACC2BE47_DIPCM|nr:hypothetical protein O6H91_16G080200 [Diphasiastrum complanatum]KAJ7528015.1 hypothetical protein O6H91_16G080200 [Diphasiastrum complanatum]KAJ7528016.1 hypothetical protein O6H91_16G080200 [Diphasiastrum complanatum]KAJ7528017.1 hypothetical protein O6H91_16G080200 [Diphasiastrum complanatum]KAJ7528018.1 hypothetical protein O6H91_16G080200 [Diphasiastrum complanatum]